MRLLPERTVPDQRGSITVIAVFFALVIAGLAVTMIEVGLASRRLQSRGDSNLYALEAAETGTAFAEQEIQSQTDPDGDGIGNVSGTYAGMRFTTTATPDAATPGRYTIDAQGWHGQIGRRIETCSRLVPGTAWDYGLFAKDGLVLGSSGTKTDAYDSRLGPYVTQAVNVDKNGSYALMEGSIGSNGSIDLSSQVHVYGDATPGPGSTVAMSNGATVTGDTTPAAETVDLPPTPLAEFQAAATTNDNGKWLTTGKVNYDPVTKDLIVNKGVTITLTGGTYFFHSITLSGNAILKIVDGPVKIYVTDLASLGGGIIANATNKPHNLQFYQHPYPLPAGASMGNNKGSFSGGAGASFVYYAPETALTLSGNGAVMGSIIGKTIDLKGGGSVHFDIALREQMMGGRVRLQRLFWRDLRPPQR
ncbi:MAG TPA: hypothetical protein VF384_13300 [Planctomycetota bacterium]